jgi:hypothetical protein
MRAWLEAAYDELTRYDWHPPWRDIARKLNQRGVRDMNGDDAHAEALANEYEALSAQQVHAVGLGGFLPGTVPRCQPAPRGAQGCMPVRRSRCASDVMVSRADPIRFSVRYPAPGRASAFGEAVIQ